MRQDFRGRQTGVALVALLALVGCSQGKVTGGGGSSGTTSSSSGGSSSSSGTTSSSSGGSSSSSGTTGSSSGTTSSGGTAAWNLSTGANADDLVEDVAFGHTVSVDLTAGTFTYTDPLTLASQTGALPSTGSTTLVLGADPTSATTVIFTKDAYGLACAPLTPEGVFLKLVLSGAYAGSITLDPNRKLQLALAGVTIASSDGPALNIQSRKRTYVVLEDGSTNTLSDSGSAGAAWSARTLADGTPMDLKGTLFSEGPLVFSGGSAGTGTLAVTGLRKAAVSSDAHVRVRGGRLTLSATGLTTADGKDGLHARAAFVMDGGTLSVSSRYGDGVQVEGNEDVTTPLGFVVVNGGALSVVSYGHGLRAAFDPADGTVVETASTADDPDPFVLLNGGTVEVTTTGAAADGIRAASTLTVNGGAVTVKTASGRAKGLQSKGALVVHDGTLALDTRGTTGEGMKSTLGAVTIDGGTISITSGEDGIAAETGITLGGGSLYVKSGSGDTDGLDSNSAMTIGGGLLVVDGSPNSPGDALDTGTGLTFSGGTFFTVGGVPPAFGPPGQAGTGEVTTATVPTVKLSISPSTWASAFNGKMLLVGTTSGAPLFAFKLPTETTTGMLVHFRHPGLVAGTTYQLFTGTGAVTGTAFHDLYLDAPAPAAGTWTSVGSFTAGAGLVSKSL